MLILFWTASHSVANLHSACCRSLTVDDKNHIICKKERCNCGSSKHDSWNHLATRSFLTITATSVWNVIPRLQSTFQSLTIYLGWLMIVLFCSAVPQLSWAFILLFLPKDQQKVFLSHKFLALSQLELQPSWPWYPSAASGDSEQTKSEKVWKDFFSNSTTIAYLDFMSPKSHNTKSLKSRCLHQKFSVSVSAFRFSSGSVWQPLLLLPRSHHQVVIIWWFYSSLQLKVQHVRFSLDDTTRVGQQVNKSWSLTSGLR